MPAYRYEAATPEGQTRRGVLTAANARAARDQLRAEGLLPLAVEETAATATPAGKSASARLPASEVAVLTRQWGTLLGSGLPLEQALAALADQTEQPAARTVLNQVRTDILAGQSLAAALGRFPRVFPQLYRALVAAGTETGQLAPVLDRLADYLDSRQLLRQKLGLALLYPMLVLFIAIGVIATMLLYVVPQVVSVFQQTRQTLPWLTRALIASSDFLRATGPYWLVLFAGGVVGGRLALRRGSARSAVHRLLLRLPVVGPLLRAIDASRFSGTLAILVGSGTPLLRALDAASDVLLMLPLRDAARNATSRVREGVPLARALDVEKAFPPLLIHLVASGEQSGRLPAMLEKAAQQQEREVERRLAWLTGLLEPALILIMGGIVLLLVLAVMLPIVSINQLVR